MSDFDALLAETPVEIAEAPRPPPEPVPPSSAPPAAANSNVFDALIQQGAQPVDPNRDAKIRARSNIYGAQGSSPDTTAKAIDLGKQTGLPVDTVERNLPRVQRDVETNKYNDLLDKSPALLKWLEDQTNARVSNDDYESLGLLEKGWNEIKRGFFGQRSGAQAVGATIAGQRLADLEAAQQKAARGEYLTRAEQLMLAQAPEARANAEAASTSSIGKLLENKRAAEEIPMRPALRELNDAKTWGEAWSALGKDPLGIIFDLTAGNAPQLLTSTAAALAGGPVAGVATMGAQSFGMEFVSGILDNMQELGVKTDDPEALRTAFANPELMATVYRKTTIKAAIVGTLDASTMGIAGKTLAPAAVKSRLAKEAVNMPAQLAIQMAGGAGGEALGSVAAGNEVKPGAVLAEAVAELGSAPADVVAMRGHFGKTKKPTSPEQQQAEVQAAGLDRLVADAQSTKLAGRSPEKLEEFLSTVTGPDQNVFIPAETIQTYMQSKSVEDMRALSDALGITDQLPEALARGGDVVIPIAKYVTEAGKSDVHKAWREDVRMEADGFSIRQAQEDAKVRDERLKLAVDRFEKQLEAGIAEVDPTTRVYEDIRDKLKTLGQFTNEAAEQQAALFAERYAARAARNAGSYVDAWDAYSKAGTGKGLDIRSQLSERVGAYPPDDLDVLLNSIRSGKVAPSTTDADASAQFAKDREELSRELQASGIDIRQTNAQIRQAIKAEVEKRKAGTTYEQPVYHGTPHIFDKFSLDKIGTGEGAQAYGWGLYFASKKSIAEHYRNVLSKKNVTLLDRDGNDIDTSQWPLNAETFAATILLNNDGDYTKAEQDIKKWSSKEDIPEQTAALQALKDKGITAKAKNEGRLYHVEIPEDGAYLHWDKPLSEQSPEVLAKLEAAYKAVPDRGPRSSLGRFQDMVADGATGEDAYKELAAMLQPAVPPDPAGTPRGWGFVQRGDEGQKAASLALREAGIPGIQYLDQASRSEGDGTHNYVLFDDSLAEIKSYEQSAIQKPGPDAPGVGVDAGNKLGFGPELRVKVPNPGTLPTNKGGNPAPLITQTTTNKNAAEQISAIDKVLKKFKKATDSVANWAKMQAYAFASDEVPVPPYAFIKDLNSDGAAAKVGSLTPGQIEDANHGFEAAREFRRAYENNELTAVTTGKLFMWSFLSRGVSPYTQESLFIDAFKGSDEWIRKAAAGEFTEADLAGYAAWASTAAPAGSGQPGAGSTHNLNAFGKSFLLKMSQKNEDGISYLQHLHNMLSDPAMTGQKIRREFLKFGEGVGIDNKVVSFTLLVVGHGDVMVIDRVQTRQLWDDGRFSAINIYDGQKNDEGKVITGTALANLTYGARGLLVYEAIERGLAAKIQDIYTAAGRPDDASIGRYHWESWVAYSQQEASHGTLDAILKDAKGDDQAIAQVSAKQGEYGAYEYGARYARDVDGTPFFQYTSPSGETHDFSVAAFRAFLSDIKKPGTGVVSGKFKVTESGNAPWYTREGVDQAKLGERAAYWADRGSGTGEGGRALREAAASQGAADGERAAAGGDQGVGATYEQEARGNISFTDNRTVISLFESRDLSTLIHESGHLFLAELEFDAKAPGASEQVKRDYQAVLDHLGAKDGYITRGMHEQFARAFETYAMEGKAPSAALASAFRSFKRWLTQIYKRLTALNSPITPELRQVFDRLIATDEQIENAQTVQGLNPVFKDAKSADMTEAEFRAYTARANAVVDEAEQKLLQSTMDTIRKQRTREWKADEKLVREDVTSEVMSESGMQALELLTKGEFPVGTTPEVLKGIKLTKEDIVSLYGDEIVLRLLPAGIYRDRSAGPGAMSPDELAPMLGLDSGKDLIERLMQLEEQRLAMSSRGDKRSVARARIDEETAQRMNERYGDPLNDGTIEQEAMAAVHSDKQAALMATELKVLAKKAGHTGTITWADIKAWAAGAIADKSVRDGTQYQQFLRAERQAGRKVEQALIKGDFVAAFKAKQDQMVNHALYMEARDAAADVDSARKLMDRYAGAATLKGMDQDYLEQIHALLEDYEFKNRSATLLAERKSFEEWAAEQAAMGKEIVPPPRLAKGLGQTNYRDMTVDELRGLVDTVKQIAHLGRTKRKLELDGQKRELDATLTEMEATAAKGVQRGESLSVRGKSDIEISVGKAKHWLRVANAELLKIERLLEFADGRKDGQGIYSRMIFRPIAKAQDNTNDRRVELGKQQKVIYEKVPWAQRKQWTQRLAVPELGPGKKLTKEEIITVALNMGNAENLEKMLLGEKWTEDGVRAVVDKHLTKEEWQFVEDMWKLLDSQWPEFSAMVRDTQGVAPPKVEAVPLVTPYGTLSGGYYPIAYDRRENLKAAKVGEMQDSALLLGMAPAPKYGRPSTKAGASHTRTGFNAPLELSLSVIGKHLDEVTHDIFHRRAVMDIYKIISNDRFREALRSRLGPEYEAQFLPWLQRVSSEARVNNSNLKGWDSAMKALRVNVTAMAMGLRVSTMVQQVSGYAVSMQRLGSKYMLLGMAEFVRHPIDVTRKVQASSGAMRNRANNLERDIKANVDKFRGKSTWKASLGRWAFRGIAMADMAVSVPTWIGAYHKGMAEGMAEADAMYYADKMVRDTQGEGGTKDMAAFQDGSETWKLMSMFYSFLNVFYNSQQGLVEDARTPGKSFSQWADLFWQASLLMVVSPIMAALLAGQGPGDEEDPLWWALRKIGFGAFSGIPLVRDVANTIERDMGGQPSGGFKMSPVQGPIEGSVRLIHDLQKAATGEDVGKNFIKNTFNVVGGFTGLPTGQPGVTAQFFYDALISGSENPENILEWLRGMTYGPEKK